MMKRQYSSRVYPLSTYRDPNYESDSSFENYYLTYPEEEEDDDVEKATPRAGCGGVGMMNELRNVVRENTENLETTSRCRSKKKKKKKTKKEDDEKKRLFIDDDEGRRLGSRVGSPDRRRVVLKMKKARKEDDETSSGVVVDNSSSSCSSQRRISSIDDEENYNCKENNIISNGDDYDENDDGDSEAVLFTRRVLQNADMNEQQHRLSLPCKQVEYNPFTPCEWATLSNKEPVHASLLDPRGIEYPIRIRLTKAGPSTYCYGIGKPWLQIVRDNGFQPGIVLDVRVARPRPAGQLRFSLRRVVAA